MEKDKLEIILEDILDELKSVNNGIREHKQQAIELQEKLVAFEEKISQIKQPASAVADLQPVQAALDEAVIKIQNGLSQQSRPLVRHWRFLLFPEHYAKEYYKVIFRLILWMTLASMGCFLFVLGKQALENAQEVKLRQLEYDQYKNAWQYLYEHETKQGKKKMHDAWQKSCEAKQ